jgi:hypothetical protein
MSTPTTAETTAPPRTRWAAIVWGLLFAAIAATALWMIADDARRDGVADALVALTPITIVTILLLTVGVLLLVGGAAGLIRRAQRKLATTASTPQHEVPDPLAE